MEIESLQGVSDWLETKKRNQFLHFTLRPSDSGLLDLLPERDRDILESKGTYKERSELLGIPIGTVRSRTHRARAALERLRQSQPDYIADSSSAKAAR